MNMDELRYKDLIDDMALINIDKLTFDEFKQLINSITKLLNKINNSSIVRVLENDETFKNEKFDIQLLIKYIKKQEMKNDRWKKEISKFKE